MARTYGAVVGAVVAPELVGELAGHELTDELGGTLVHVGTIAAISGTAQVAAIVAIANPRV